jgi:hypothetical protein
VTPARRHHLIVALIAALAGAGIGLEVARAGVALQPSLAWWLGVIGIIALVLVLITAPEEQAAAPAATPARAGWAEFRRELRRSRRSVRPMTLLRLPGAVRPEAAEMADLAARSRRLHEHLRLVDRTWVDDGSVYVLLPESPRAAADALLGRLRSVAPDLVAQEVRMATFPDDGLTSGALISAVHGASLSEVPTPIRAALAEDDVEPFGLEDAQPLPETASRS